MGLTSSIKNSHTKKNLDKELLTQAANEARGLAMDAVSSCKSGHLGLPLGAAELGAVLFGHTLVFDPEDPKWINRDRFILSAGHGSMFLYAWLHLSGVDLSLEEIKNFRKLHSKTPGHPESIETPGVECTTGPLGQGVGNAVGMAVAAKMAENLFNTQEHTIFNHSIVCLCGDGCLQEGVAAEALSFAGRYGLDNLILVYDSNDVTLDAQLEKTQSENVAARFEAYGFNTTTIDGHDLEAFFAAYNKAKTLKNKKPHLIIAKTIIGKGIPEVAGTFKAHGEGGAKYVESARHALGLPKEPFYVSKNVRNYFAKHKEALRATHTEWKKTFESWQQKNPNLAQTLQKGIEHELPENFLETIPPFDKETNIATREASGQVLNAIAKKMPLLISGSADLHGSTKNYIKDGGDFDLSTPTGKNIYFGIREHAMGAIVNGFGYYGIFKASGATFLTFSDYMRPAIRLAALSELPIFHIFTHDSIGVGEDGPTHQPVEQVSALRLIPNLDVIRPSDPEETVGAYFGALERTNGPTALILSRQAVPNLSDFSSELKRKGVLAGAYILKEETQELETILLATGSEVQYAVAAAKALGESTRVVSMPCFERFERQDEAYKNKVLPPNCKKRIAIEAGVPHLWWSYVGKEGKVIGVNQFGLSAPGNEIYKEYKITIENIIQTAQSLS